jgi:hypothetical protein
MCFENTVKPGNTRYYGDSHYAIAVAVHLIAHSSRDGSEWLWPSN